MVHVGDSGPAGAVKRNSHGVFVRWHASLEISVDRGINVEPLPIQRILFGIEKRRRVVGLGIPRAGVVVAIDRNEINLLSGLTQIDVDVVLRAGRSVERHYIALVRGLAKYIKLAAEFLQQGSEVLGVGRCGKFPIDIEPIKQPGSCNARSDVSADKHVDAGSRERLASS